MTDFAAISELAPDILSSEGFERCKTFMQHGTVSVYEHVVQVASVCERFARRHPSLARRELVRGALLHDYFLYDWHDRASSRPHHATRHGSYALENAERDFELTAIERDIIEHHMFPLALAPRTKEGWLVCMVDKAVSLAETLGGFAHKLRRLASHKKA